jgi:ABC-type amino acid transport substrate-binding protein
MAGSNAIFTTPEAALRQLLSNREYNTVKKGVLTVAVYANFYPVAYKKGQGYSGIDVDLMQLFCKFANLKCKFIEWKDFNGIWLAPIQGLADVAIGGIGITPSRTRAKTAWTIPYFYVDRSIVYNKNDPIISFPRDCRGTICGTKGSTGWLDGAIKMKKVRKQNLMVPGKTDEQDIKDLRSGKIQGLMRGSFVAKALVKKYPKELGMTKPWKADPSIVSSDGEVFAFPCKCGSGIAESLSAFITFLINSKIHKRLLKKHNLV